MTPEERKLFEEKIHAFFGREVGAPKRGLDDVNAAIRCRAGIAPGDRIMAGRTAAALQGRDEAQAGQALIDHVRFEERELFPVLETLFEEARP